MKWRNTVCSSLIFAFASFFNAHSLTAENAKESTIIHQSDDAFMSNAQAQLQLTSDQYPKFEADHNSFTSQLAAIKKKYNNNLILAKNDINKLIAETDKSIKTYLSGVQFQAYKKLYNTGQLGKNSNPAVKAGVNTSPSSSTGSDAQISTNAGISAKTNTGSGNTPHQVSVSSLKINALVDPFKDILKLTPDQYNKLDADTKAYDAKLAAMGGDATSQSAEIKALNEQTIAKFKTYLNADQVNRFVAACTMQQNILTGKSLNPQQKAIINKMRNDYHMNDGQIEMVVLVWAEGKVKLDAIQANASKDPQGALQASKTVLNTADAKMKKILTPEQYNDIHDDIIADMKK